MSQTKARAAYEGRLATWAAARSTPLRVAYENAGFTPATDETQAAFERTANKPLRAPVLVAVAVEPSAEAKVPEIEELAAGAAAVQNLLLAAHALGLGAIWRTGEPCYHPAVKTFFGLDERAHLLGFVYLGYPVAAPPVRQRTAAEQITTWFGWDEGTAIAAD